MADLISRQAVQEWLSKWEGYVDMDTITRMQYRVIDIPSAQPYTDEQIQKMQELEQAEIEKAFQLGREDLLSEIVRCKDCKYYEIAWLKKDGTDNRRYKPSVCVRGQYAVHHSSDWFCADAERREDG